MSSSKITLLGLYNHNSHIFDGLQFPAGIDRQMAIDEILMRSGEFEILYPDMAFLTDAITHWGRKHFRTFEQWIRALAIEFDPLYNYDRFEEYTDEKASQGSQGRTGKETGAEVMQTANHTAGTESGSEIGSHSSDSTQSGSENTTGNSVSGTDSNSATDETKDRQVSAYDEATYQNREKETTDNDNSGHGSGYAVNTTSTTKGGTDAQSASDVTTHGATDERSGETSSSGQSQKSTEEQAHDSRIEQIKHTAHLYGNIGVTTSTQMLEDFLRVERFTIYEQIADIFVDEFCILIY